MKTVSIHLPFKKGRLIYTPDHGDALTPSDWVFATNLSGKLISRDGEVKDEFDFGSGLVTTAGVVLLSQDTAVTAGTAALAAFKYHGTGTGTTAAAVSQTTLVTAIGSTATTGTNTNASASPNATVTSTATVSYSGTFAVTEWALFNSATLAGATMWDRKVFSAINVISGDSIAFTYALTLNSGG